MNLKIIIQSAIFTIISIVCVAQTPMPTTWTMGEVVNKMPTEPIPFNATKSTRYIRNYSYTINNSSNVIPDRLYLDVQLTQYVNASVDPELWGISFRKFAISNSSRALLVVTFGHGYGGSNLHVLCVVNTDGTIVSTLEGTVMGGDLYVKQFRINAQSQVVVSTLVPTSYTPIMFDNFTSFEAQRVDITYDINAQGQFVQVSETKFYPRDYTRAELESQSNDIWNGGEVPIVPIDPTKPALVITEVEFIGDTYGSGRLLTHLKYSGPQLVFGSCTGCYNSDISMWLDYGYSASTFSYMNGETLNNGDILISDLRGIDGYHLKGIHLKPYAGVYIVGTGWVEFQTPTIPTKPFANTFNGSMIIYP